MWWGKRETGVGDIPLQEQEQNIATLASKDGEDPFEENNILDCC